MKFARTERSAVGILFASRGAGSSCSTLARASPTSAAAMPPTRRRSSPRSIWSPSWNAMISSVGDGARSAPSATGVGDCECDRRARRTTRWPRVCSPRSPPSTHGSSRSARTSRPMPRARESAISGDESTIDMRTAELLARSTRACRRGVSTSYPARSSAPTTSSPRPRVSKLDYEGEVAVVLGVDAGSGRAPGPHVWGVTAWNDLSIRDPHFGLGRPIDRPPLTWSLQKNFDTGKRVRSVGRGRRRSRRRESSAVAPRQR